MRIFLILVLLISTTVFAKNKRKVIYKYKKYEKFEMDDLNIEGEAGGPGDLSINPRFRKKFKNRLPSKPNFNREMAKSINSVL